MVRKGRAGMQEITLGQIAEAMVFIIGLIGSITYFMKAIKSPLTAIEGKIDSLSEETNEHFKRSDEATATMLHDRIEGYYYSRAVRDGYISLSDYATVHRMYESYKALGGNGAVAKEMEIIDQLPIK